MIKKFNYFLCENMPQFFFRNSKLHQTIVYNMVLNPKHKVKVTTDCLETRSNLPFNYKKLYKEFCTVGFHYSRHAVLIESDK